MKFNYVLDSKETFSFYKNKIFLVSKIFIFPKGLTHADGQKMQLFLYLFLVKKRLEIRSNTVLDRKQTFLITKSQKSHSLKGVNPCF